MSLVISSFATGPISVFASLLLIDIGRTFGTPVGVTGQLNTIYSISALIVALLTGILSTTFRHRSLLLGGMGLMLVSALGCYLAQDLLTMMASFSLSGVGYALVNPMTFTLVGRHLPVGSRPNAVGLIVAGGALVYVIGAPIIAIVAGIGGWRLPLLEFVVPVLFASLLLSHFGLPRVRGDEGHAVEKGTYIRGFKEVFTNRSAVACLVGDFLRSASFVAIVFFSPSFMRQKFNASTDLASLVIIGGAMSYVAGSLLSGSYVNRLGRKLSVILAALFAGTFTATYVLASDFYISVALTIMASWFFGLLASSANSLTLEQISSFRGTMMSLDTAAFNMGSALGTTVGGLALLFSGYVVLGLVLGALCILAVFVWGLFAVDPTRKRKA